MSLNKVLLIGHVGKEPVVRKFDSGQVATFSLATTEKYKDKDGNWQDQTEWHNIVCRGYTAEKVEKYVKKGMQLYVEGKIRSRSYDTPDGKKMYITEIMSDKVDILEKRDQEQEKSQNREAVIFPERKDKQQSHADSPDTPDDLPFE